MTKQTSRTMCIGSEHGFTPPVRRGIALMLVVVAMGTATVMTTAYLLSKDNSAAIGVNAQNTAASAWTARSGADLALAILQTQESWVDAEPENLLEGFAIAGGTVSIVLTDLQGNPPDGTETDLAMTIVADVNGVKTVLQRIVTIQPDADLGLAADAELGEFGVFASSGLTVEKNAKIGVWPLSPQYRSGGGVKVGAGFVEASKMLIAGDSVASSSELYVRPDAATPLQAMTKDSTFVGGAVLDLIVPYIPPLMPIDIGAAPVVQLTDLVIDDSSLSRRLVSGIYARLKTDGLDSVVTLDDTDGGMYLFEDVHLDHESVLRISGDVLIGVANNFRVENLSALEFADDSSRVRVYVGKQFKVNRAAVGLPREIARKADRTVRDIKQYIDPLRLRVYALISANGGDLDPDIDIFAGSIANMVVHAPLSHIEIKGGSWLIGRLTGDVVKIKDDSALLYDPALDPRTGYTAFNGPYYKKNSREPLDGLAEALVSYDVSLGLEGFKQHILTHSVQETTAVAPLVSGDPTPRSGKRAVEKPWPFTAKAIEERNLVVGGATELQESLFVPLDSTIFDLKEFYESGVIIATYTKSGTEKEFSETK